MPLQGMVKGKQKKNSSFQVHESKLSTKTKEGCCLDLDKSFNNKNLNCCLIVCAVWKKRFLRGPFKAHTLSEPPNLHHDEAISESLRITSPSLAVVTQPLIFPVSSACYATPGWMSHSSLPNSATYVLRVCTRCWCKWNLQVSAEAWMMYFSATQMGNRAKGKKKRKKKTWCLVFSECGAWDGML